MHSRSPEQGLLSLRERLEALDTGAMFEEIALNAGLSKEQTGIDHVIKIDVQDADMWGSEETAEKLFPYFGELTWTAYLDRDDETPYDPEDPEIRATAIDNIVNADLGSSKYVYAAFEGEKMVGFISASDLDTGKDGEKGCIVDLTVVRRENRDHDIGRGLREYIFSNDFDVIAGVSSTPAAVKNSVSLSKEYDYEITYCGIRVDEEGATLSDEAKGRVKEISKNLTQAYVDFDCTIPAEEIPENFVVVRADVEPIPPITADDLHFKNPDEPVAKVFHETVLPMQEKLLPHTVYGIWLSRKKESK